ncbi:MAG TPA: pyridoxal phosphate-dependent aminotransferase [Steroidobacteraceae bacterium]|nr:pyridoxal phosphate-dependent aminotransferase [Steroidobacteraceae bacterium]
MNVTPEAQPAPAPAHPAADQSYTSWARAALSELLGSGGRAISLFESSVPEPTDLLARSLAELFGQGFTPRYVSAFVRGNPYVVRQLQRRYGVSADSVLCTTGASSSLSLIYRAYLKPGDRVLVEDPAFDLFAVLARQVGVIVDRFERSAPQFAIQPDRIAKAMHPRTKLIVCTNLHNPSGSLMGVDVLREIGTLAGRHGALVVVDEVYGDYAGTALTPAASVGDNMLSIGSLTKNYGLSTLRCGWAIGHPRALNPVRQVYEDCEFGVSKLTHSVAASVLEQPEPYIRYREEMLAACRPVMHRYHAQWVADGLVEGHLPDHGCIYFPRLAGIDDTASFAAALARRHGVYVAPGEYFGKAGHVRIGFAMPVERLSDALELLTAALRARR